MSGAVREVTVHALVELIQEVAPQRPDPNTGRLREQAVYRGVADTDRALLTSLDRLGVPEVPPHSRGHLEEHLMRNFLRYARPHLQVAPGNEWEVLVLAQHHGLPTRLLDWSHSPLVAAHFATVDDERDTDRVVWKLDWGTLHAHFGLPRLALTVEELDQVLEDRGIRTPWELFSGAYRGSEPFAALLDPPALDGRIVAQSAAFTVCTDRTRTIDAVLEEAGLPKCLTRCVIPHASVSAFRDQLDLCGVDERRLFPDLDGVAAQLRRYYSAAADEPESGCSNGG
jgi:hypothetical protein